MTSEVAAGVDILPPCNQEGRQPAPHATDAPHIGLWAKTGRAQRLATGIYAVGATLGPDDAGHLKRRPNVAGGYPFVAPDLVVGTLLRGFDVLDRLHDPLARAVAMMALVTERHPFDDGNGRVARLTANAELSHAGEVRIVIPTVYRNNYLARLNALSNGTGKGAPLVAVLDFAQRWTGAIDWTSYDGTDRTLQECNAYLDPVQAETTNRTLRLPAPG